MLDSGTGIASISACRDCDCKACTLVWEVTRLPMVAGMDLDRAQYGTIDRYNGHDVLCVTLLGRVLTYDVVVRLYAKSGAFLVIHS
jgi:hypothetical protein